MNDEEAIPLDPDLIKVLASDTRRDILRYLGERPMTVTELSKVLDLRKATVSEHLKKLTDAGLTSRREDGRLWVYYELTRSGKRIVNPGRTRFYLIVASTAIAAAAIALAAAFIVQTGGPSLEAADEAGLAVELGDARYYAGGPFALDALVAGDAELVDAYLLTPEEAQRLQAGEEVSGTPLRVTSDGAGGQEEADPMMAYESGAAMDDGADAERASAPDEASEMDGAGTAASTDGAAPTAKQLQASPFVGLEASGPVPPGVYLLYVRDSMGRDNLAAMPLIEVAPISLTVRPGTFWQGLDGPVSIAVAEGPPELGATLVLRALRDPAAAPSLTARIEQGAATLPVEALDRLAPGGYELELLPDGDETFRRTGSVLVVREPQVAVAPLTVSAGPGATATLWVHAGEGRDLGALNVRLDGEPLSVLPEGPQRAALSLASAGLGDHALTIGRLVEQTITVEPALAPTLHVAEDRLVLAVHTPGGTPQPDVGVRLGDTFIGVTNFSGHIDFHEMYEHESAGNIDDASFGRPDTGGERLFELHTVGGSVRLRFHTLALKKN